MTIQVNGEVREIDAESTVAALVAVLGLSAQAVLVERNGAALFPREFATTKLASGDRLELVQLAAGG